MLLQLTHRVVHLNAGREGAGELLQPLLVQAGLPEERAIHGLFHVVEWLPELKEAVLLALKEVAAEDPEPILRDFAGSMANDIEAGGIDHHPEPVFPEEV